MWHCEEKKLAGIKDNETKNSTILQKMNHGITTRRLAIFAIAVFVVTLLPIIYLTFVNRASGDDYGYGTYTHAAWLTTHSLIEVVKAIGQTIRQYYYSWQGTWFSIALFTLQPEVFSDQAYVIVTPLMLILWIGSTFYLFRELLVNRIKVDLWGYRLLTVLFLLISMQFIPGKKSSLFWFNGCAHYMIPFTMCQFLVAWLLKWGRTYAKKYFVGIFTFMMLLGGSNYQASLLALIMVSYCGMYEYLKGKDKRNFLLLLPVAAEIVGLLISALAPGNQQRGGGQLAMTVEKMISTIGACFVQGARDAKKYLWDQPMVLVLLLMLFFLLCEQLRPCIKAWKLTNQKHHLIRKHPLISSMLLICLYSAMQAPAIYANVEVSQGVGNTNFLVLLLSLFGIMMILADQLLIFMEKHDRSIQMILPVLLVGLIGMIICRNGIKESTDYICFEYIVTGQAADYKKQMDLQTRLLLQSDTDVVIPMINDWQGPLMHMPVTDDPAKWTNGVTADFYGKDSVIAIPRTEWLEIYGEGGE